MLSPEESEYIAGICRDAAIDFNNAEQKAERLHLLENYEKQMAETQALYDRFSKMDENDRKYEDENGDMIGVLFFTEGKRKESMAEVNLRTGQVIRKTTIKTLGILSFDKKPKVKDVLDKKDPNHKIFYKDDFGTKFVCLDYDENARDYLNFRMRAKETFEFTALGKFSHYESSNGKGYSVDRWFESDLAILDHPEYFSIKFSFDGTPTSVEPGALTGSFNYNPESGLFEKEGYKGTKNTRSHTRKKTEKPKTEEKPKPEAKTLTDDEVQTLADKICEKIKNDPKGVSRARLEFMIANVPSAINKPDGNAARVMKIVNENFENSKDIETETPKETEAESYTDKIMKSIYSANDTAKAYRKFASFLHPDLSHGDKLYEEILKRVTPRYKG